MSRKLTLILLLVLPASLVAASSQAPDTKKPDQSAPSPSQGAPVPATTDPNYKIGAQDVVDINVWKEPELTRTVPVRPDGKISLPLLNDVQASGLTPQQLTTEITAGLKKYVTDPQVTVIVTGINSQRVYILGEVNRPGEFPMLHGMTAVQALSAAGGFTAYASVKKIYILRTEDGKQAKYPLNYKAVIAGKAPEQNIELKAGDTIVVP